MSNSQRGSDSIENKLVAVKTSGTRRRAALLSASALTGAFALLMASPQSALAQCAASSFPGPNVVNCNATTATANSTTVNPFFFTFSRSNVFTLGGDVAATVQPGVTVFGNGLSITTTVPGAAINFNNEGSVQSSLTSSNALQGGPGVVTLNGAGGTVTYTGNGSIIDNFVGVGQGAEALRITNSGPGGIVIGSQAAPVVPFFFSRDTNAGAGVIETNTGTGTGTTSIFLSGGTTLGGGTAMLAAAGANSGSNDIAAYGNGTVNILLTNHLQVLDLSTPGNTVFGILVQNGGDVNITSDALIGLPNVTVNDPLGGTLTSVAMNIGIAALPTAAASNINIDITPGGQIYFANGFTNGGGPGIGIDAATGTGNINITTEAGSLLSYVGPATAGTVGINAVTSGATGGSINIVSAGTIDPPAIGINAQILNAANPNSVNVSVPTGSVAATNIGINATTIGTGAVNVTTAAGTAITQAAPVGGGTIGGIVTSATSGTTTINVGGTVTASGNGINAASTSGLITIGSTGTITSTGGVGIAASTTGGAVSVNAANVAAAGQAVLVTTSGAGGISIGSGGAADVPFFFSRDTVAGTGVIQTQAGSGPTNIFLSGGTTAAGTPAMLVAAGTNSGSNDIATYGTGPVTISLTNQLQVLNLSTPGNAVFGILAQNLGDVNITTDAQIGLQGVTVKDPLTGVSSTTVAMNYGICATTGFCGFGASSAAANNINIHQTTGGSIFFTNGFGGPGTGIFASTGTGNINITTDAGSTLQYVGPATAGTFGINAITTGATGGGITIISGGTIDPPAIGINAQILNPANASNVNVGVPTGTIAATNIGIHATTAGTGNVNVITLAGTSITQAGPVGGGPIGGIITSATSGATSINLAGTVTASGDGINTTATTGATTIVTQLGGTVAGGLNGISATSGGGNIGIDAEANVTGGTNGIITSNAGAGTTTVIVQGVGTTVTGSGAGNSAISATTSGSGLIQLMLAGGTNITNPTGIGVTLNTLGTGAGTAPAVLDSNAVINGLGTVANPTIAVVNNNTTGNSVTINNGGTVRDAASNIAGWGVVTSTNGGISPSANLQPVDVNNFNRFFGRIWLGAGASTFTNNNGAEWASSALAGATATGDGPASQLGNGSTIANAMGGGIFINSDAAANFPGRFSGFVFTNLGGAQTGTDTITNSGLINAAGNVNFQFLGAGSKTVINNNGLTGTGLFNVGSVAGSNESTSFTSAGVQSVTNTGTFNIIGHGTGTASIGNATLAAAGPTGVGALNFQGAVGSSFNNTGGLINMQADGGSTTNAVTFNTAALGGTSDPSYTYTWLAATPGYNFVGGANSRVAVDTFLGAPGSTSDRLVVGGNVSGTTQVIVNNTNTGPGAFNPTGITVVAVQGAGSNNFVVSPQSVGYVNFGPLGAIQNGFFIDPLLYVPGGATSTGGLANGNAYKFFGVPGPFAFNLPIAHTAAQTIFKETAQVWENRQEETRNCMQHGLIAAGQAWGSGADLQAPVLKAPPAPALPDCGFGVWAQLIGSETVRHTKADLGTAFGAPMGGLNFDNSFRQQIGGMLVGVDYGKSELTSPFDSIVLSIMGGGVGSSVDFNSGNQLGVGGGQTVASTSFQYTGGTVGGSATYMNRGFFIDALLKADFLSLNIGNIPGAFCTTGGFGLCGSSVSSTTWGVFGDMGYRFEFGRAFFEPVGSVIWASNNISNLVLPAAGVTAQFGNVQTVDVGGGGRGGGIIMDDRVHYLEASVLGKVWDHVSGDNPVSFVNLGPTFTLTDQQLKGVYAESAVQFDWINRRSGFSAYADFDAKFNKDFQTFTGKLGARYGF